MARSRWYLCCRLLYVITENCGFARRLSVGFPASDTNVKLRNVEMISTGML